jgi:hypothetical protein
MQSVRGRNGPDSTTARRRMTMHRRGRCTVIGNARSAMAAGFHPPGLVPNCVQPRRAMFSEPDVGPPLAPAASSCYRRLERDYFCEYSTISRRECGFGQNARAQDGPVRGDCRCPHDKVHALANRTFVALDPRREARSSRRKANLHGRRHSVLAIDRQLPKPTTRQFEILVG